MIEPYVVFKVKCRTPQTWHLQIKKKKKKKNFTADIVTSFPAFLKIILWLSDPLFTHLWISHLLRQNVTTSRGRIIQDLVDKKLKTECGLGFLFLKTKKKKKKRPNICSFGCFFLSNIRSFSFLHAQEFHHHSSVSCTAVCENLKTQREYSMYGLLSM